LGLCELQSARAAPAALAMSINVGTSPSAAGGCSGRLNRNQPARIRTLAVLAASFFRMAITVE